MAEIDDDTWDYDDEYDPEDYGRPKEEPDCGGCNDAGWYRPRGWRLIAAQLAPILWGRGSPWNWRPRRGTWPCQGCNCSWLEWQLGRLNLWRSKAFKTRRAPAGAYYDDEPPF